MNYLDTQALEAISTASFRREKPFPWVNPYGLLSDEGYTRLLENMPGVESFERVFGKARKFGQKSHDRFTLEYRSDLDIPEPWSEFIAELEGDEYSALLRRLFGREPFRLRYHWHYSERRGSISPHCDSKSKLGSHIFYFNTSQDWDPAWGGETVLFDDGGRFSRGRSPGFSDFDGSTAASSLGNYSLLFRRTNRSWHGVREIQSPDGAMRKVFIVVVDRWSWKHRLRTRLRGEHRSDY